MEGRPLIRITGLLDAVAKHPHLSLYVHRFGKMVVATPLQNLNNTVPFACDRGDSTRGAIVEKKRESFDPLFGIRGHELGTRRGVGSRLEVCQSGFKLDTNTR